MLICREYMKLEAIWDMWCVTVGSPETVWLCVSLCIYVPCERARTLRELESSDSIRPLPIQTWAWLLLLLLPRSNESETGRQSATWLRVSTPPLHPPPHPRCIFMPHSDGFMPGYMSLAYQIVCPTRLAIPKDLTHHRRVMCNLTWFCSRVQFGFLPWGRQSLIGPATRLT